MNASPQNESPLLTPRELGRLFLFTVFAVMLSQAISLFIQGKWAMIIQELCIILPAVIYVVVKKISVRHTFRLSLTTPIIFFYALLISIAVVVLTDELDRIITLYFPMPEELAKAMEEFMVAQSLADTIWLLLGAVAVAALAEEMLFRGVILTSLEQFKDGATAIVLSAIFFALIHFNPWGAVQIVILGFVLGYLSWKSQSIWPSVMLHGLNNLVAYLWINVPRTSWSWYCGETHVHYYWLMASVLLLIVSVDRFNKACEAAELANTLMDKD